MATRSLSPKRIQEKIQLHRCAVMALAMHRAKDEVKANIRAKGLKLGQFSAREITLLAEAELERNRVRFIAEAEHSINTWPGFARWRLTPEVFEKITENEHSPSASSTNAGLIAND